ncbi:MAG: cell division protein FtsH, partial [Actinomycetes bacterium]
MKSFRWRYLLIWLVVGLIGLTLFSMLRTTPVERIMTSQGLELIRSGAAEQIEIVDIDQRVKLTLKEDLPEGLTEDLQELSGVVEFFYVEPQGPEIVDAVRAADPELGYNSTVNRGSIWTSILFSFLPVLLIIGLIFFLMSSMQGGGRIMQFGRSRATQVAPDTPKVKFEDVAGVDEAVEELREIQEFLQSPAKFQAVGAKIPKGVLLYGPPGTGKT